MMALKQLLCRHGSSSGCGSIMNKHSHGIASKAPISTNVANQKKYKVPPLCSPKWVAERMSEPSHRIIPIDGSWHMPTLKRDARVEFEKAHIKSARFFDIDEARDKTHSAPHMLPNAKQFSEYLTKLNISPEDHVVVYDSYGIFSACRVAWTFKVFGHERISILNGGLGRWRSEGYPIISSTEAAESPKKPYPVPKLQEGRVKNYAEIASLVSSEEPQAIILDARSKKRFTGEDPEPRAGLSSGHMPHSKSLPFGELLNLFAADYSYTTFKDPKEIGKIFNHLELDAKLPIVTSCGTGVTACVLEFGLSIARHVEEDQIPSEETSDDSIIGVYDGSWTEYASQKDSVILQ